MPAPLGEGGPVALCHGGLAGAYFRELAAPVSSNVHMHMADHSAGIADEHRHSDEEPDSNHDAWENCPVGAAFSAASVSHEFALSLPDPGHDFARVEPDAMFLIAFTASYRARAPPHAFSRRST